MWGMKMGTNFDEAAKQWDLDDKKVRRAGDVAKDILKQQGLKARDNKGRVDQLAARIMLQEFLDSKGTR